MNTDTGQIVEQEDIDRMDEPLKRKFIPITRDLTVKERFNKQISLYAHCGCGSGKKFKFCCYTGK